METLVAVIGVAGATFIGFVSVVGLIARQETIHRDRQRKDMLRTAMDRADGEVV